MLTGSRGHRWVAAWCFIGSLAALAGCAPPTLEEQEEGESTALHRDAVVDIGSIDPARELFITDVSVVDDPFYTAWAPNKKNTDPQGAWSFGRLIDNLMPEYARTPYRRSQYVLAWLRTWEQNQTVNGQVIPARPAIRSLIINPWRMASGCSANTRDEHCTLDFSKAPFRLLAIVYRPDLRRTPTSTEPGSAGQGRFVFGALGPQGERLSFTVILEYQLPITRRLDIVTWAERWHSLSRVPFGNAYNARLHRVTREFTRQRAAPRRVNGSALLQIRTNEVPLSPVEPRLWEMREFVLGRFGLLRPATVKQEVNAALIGTPLLGAWVNENASAILSGQHEVPSSYQGQPFLAAAAPVPSDLAWPVPGVTEEVRHAFAQSTCSGCHKSETGTNFLHVRTREKGSPAPLSDFLAEQLSSTGPRVADYFQLLSVNDLNQVQDGKAKDHEDKEDEEGEGGD